MVSGPNYVVRKGLTGCMQHYPLNFMQSDPLSVYKLKMYAASMLVAAMKKDKRWNAKAKFGLRNKLSTVVLANFTL